MLIDQPKYHKTRNAIYHLSALTFYASAVTQTFIYETKWKQLSAALVQERKIEKCSRHFLPVIESCADKMTINSVMILCFLEKSFWVQPDDSAGEFPVGTFMLLVSTRRKEACF
jgi:hypothetical protein